jgi:hypothetical protein
MDEDANSANINLLHYLRMDYSTMILTIKGLDYEASFVDSFVGSFVNSFANSFVNSFVNSFRFRSEFTELARIYAVFRIMTFTVICAYFDSVDFSFV